MATIIIQGSKEEREKALSALKNQFSVVNKKASVPSEKGLTTIVDCFNEVLFNDKYTGEDLMQALMCCSSAERNCSNCPYRKEQNCKEQLQMGGAVYVQKLFEEATKKGGNV